MCKDCHIIKNIARKEIGLKFFMVFFDKDRAVVM